MTMSDDLILRSRKPPFEIPPKSVGEVIWNRLQELDGNLTCIIDARSGTELSLNEFISQANAIAVALIGRGVEKSDKFCCFSANTIQYASLMLASYFLGITLVPISPTIASYELKKELENLGSKISLVIFTSIAFAKHFDEIIKDFNSNEAKKFQIKSIFVLDGNYSNYSPFEQLLIEGRNKVLNRIPHFDIDPKNDILVILRSSGTSGLPKSTMISHFAFVAYLMGLNQIRQLKGVRVSMIYPFGHIGGLVFLLFLLYTGATPVVFGEYDEDLILQSVEKYRINYLSIFPAFGRKLIEGQLVDKYNLSSVKLIITVGAAFPGDVAKAIIEKYNVIFMEGYGMTEFPSITESSVAESLKFIPGNVGRVGANTELKIVDLNTGQSLGPNIDGEICVKGPKMFSGYLNNMQATKDTIDNDGWLHTGDIGHYDEEERIFITDRLKELIKFGTFQVSPTEIEQFLLTHESVAEVVVVGVKHEIETQWPRAYVKVKDGKSVTEEELQKFVAGTLGYTKHLRAGVVFVNEIPRTIIGKVDRRYFKQLVANEVIKQI